MRRSVRRRNTSSRAHSPGYRAEVVEVLSRVLAKRPDVISGRVFGFPGFYTRGKLFACVYGDGVGLKLPEDMVQQLDGKPGITPFQPYGKSKMREWIHIHHDRMSRYSMDANLFEASIKFVGRSATRGEGSRRRNRPASLASKSGAGKVASRGSNSL